MLVYHVPSSDGKRTYKVSFEGEGKNLKAYCTCPAGKMAGKFCKHISGLINKKPTKLLEPSDKIEALDDVLRDSSLLSKNDNYINKNEKTWFIYNDIKISNIDDLYNFIKPLANEKIIIENDKEKGRLALYKAEYKKDGSPKYSAKNKIVFMEYSGDMNSFNVNRQSYKYFAPAGQGFIASVNEAIKEFTTP